jgi:hypothetical protein
MPHDISVATMGGTGGIRLWTAPGRRGSLPLPTRQSGLNVFPVARNRQSNPSRSEAGSQVTHWKAAELTTIVVSAGVRMGWAQKPHPGSLFNRMRWNIRAAATVSGIRRIVRNRGVRSQPSSRASSVPWPASTAANSRRWCSRARAA